MKIQDILNSIFESINTSDALRLVLGSGGFVVFFTLLYYITQIKIGRSALKASKHRATIDLLSEWRRPDFKTSQAFVLEVVSKDCVEQGEKFTRKGYRHLDPEYRLHVTQVSYYFDYLGMLCATDALDKQLLLTMLARPIVDHWETLRPLLFAERQRRAARTKGANSRSKAYVENYQSGFEHFYILARSFTNEQALSLKDDPLMKASPPPVVVRNWD